MQNSVTVDYFTLVKEEFLVITSLCILPIYPYKASCKISTVYISTLNQAEVLLQEDTFI